MKKCSWSFARSLWLLEASGSFSNTTGLRLKHSQRKKLGQRGCKFWRVRPKHKGFWLHHLSLLFPCIHSYQKSFSFHSQFQQHKEVSRDTWGRSGYMKSQWRAETHNSPKPSLVNLFQQKWSKPNCSPFLTSFFPTHCAHSEKQMFKAVKFSVIQKIHCVPQGSQRVCVQEVLQLLQHTTDMNRSLAREAPKRNPHHLEMFLKLLNQLHGKRKKSS